MAPLYHNKLQRSRSFLPSSLLPTSFAAIFFVIIFLLIAEFSHAQNNVGIGTTTPNASSILEMQSTSQGVLVPRMTTAQRTAIAVPANGLLVYDTNFDCFF